MGYTNLSPTLHDTSSVSAHVTEVVAWNLTDHQLTTQLLQDNATYGISQTAITSDDNLTSELEVLASGTAGAVGKGLVMVVVMIAAVFGNILVIIAVFKFDKLRIIANSFIVSLAFADLLVGILVMPFSASMMIAGKWVFGPVVCDIFNANDVLCCTASLLHLCCISMDRYIAIMDPFHYEAKMTAKRVIIMLLCAWGASFLVSHVPIQLGWYTTEEQREALQTFADECTFRVNRVYALVSSCISFWIPVSIMVFTYVKIYSEAMRQAKQIQALTYAVGPSMDQINRVGNGTNGQTNACGTNNAYSSSQHRKNMRRDHKAAKTLGIIMGAFLLCWLPFFTWYVSMTMCSECYTPPILEWLLFWIGYINSALNPVIYAYFNRDFRHAFKRLLCFDRLPCRTRLSRGPEADALAQGYTSEMRQRPSKPSTNSSSTPSPRATPRRYQAVGD